MKYAIKITDTAKGHLRDIAVYIAEQSKEKEVAKKFVGELVAECDMLETFPNGGANPDDRLLVSMGYKFLIHKDFLLFYTVDETACAVYVQAIFNAKKDYTRYMRKLIPRGGNSKTENKR
ncbi:MAG: type II toxin-antitoxin system RelE/ParE family toxin [Clostridia bacterium]|jgi:toxin ParE1/3/4|nr:type II toxin-antitoxin system RelE/ParE family toxin [Clostridia bacterium]